MCSIYVARKHRKYPQLDTVRERDVEGRPGADVGVVWTADSGKIGTTGNAGIPAARMCSEEDPPLSGRSSYQAMTGNRQRIGRLRKISVFFPRFTQTSRGVMASPNIRTRRGERVS